MRPNKGSASEAYGKKKLAAGGIATIYDTVYPNCMAFNDAGRLYVGDSSGIISFWDVTLKGNQVLADNYFKIKQKEIEGDQIN